MHRYIIFVIIILAGVFGLIAINGHAKLSTQGAAVSTAFSPDNCPNTQDLKTHIDLQITSRTEGIVGDNTTKPLFSSFNVDESGNLTASWNQDNWTKRGEEPLDLSGVAFYTSHTDIVGGAGALISPRHMLGANHYSFREGQVLYFVAPDNSVATRTVVTGSYRHNSSNHDISIVMLDEDLPPQFAYYPIGFKRGNELIDVIKFRDFFDLVNDKTYLGIVLDQERKALIHGMKIRNEVDYLDLEVIWHDEPTENILKSFYEELVVGDSGKPGFAVIDNQPILLFTHTYSTGGYNANHYIDWINEKMAELDELYRDENETKYQASTYDLGCFNRAPLISDTYSFSIDENSPAGSVVGTATSSDPDPGQNVTFSILESRGKKYFDIDSTSGVITVAPGANIDFESIPTHTIYVISTDGTLSRKSKVTISVNDLQDNNQSLGSWTEVTSAGKSRWTTAGISKDGQTLVAGVSNGNLSISRDGGASWTITNTDAGNKNYTDVHVSNSGTIYAVTDGGDFYKSTDYGETWNSGTIGLQFTRTISASEDGTKVAIASINSHIYISNDSGNTWSTSTQSLGPRYWRDMDMSDNGQYILASSFETQNLVSDINGNVTSSSTTPGLIYISNDGGISWRDSGLPSNTWVPVSISADGKYMIVASGSWSSEGIISYSENYGVSWQTKTIPNSESKIWRGLNISPDGSTIMVMPYIGLLYISRDKGETWVTRSDLGSKTWMPPGFFFSRNNNLVSSSEDGKKVLVLKYNDYLYLGNLDYQNPNNFSVATSSVKRRTSRGGGGGRRTTTQNTTLTPQTSINQKTPIPTPPPSSQPTINYNRNLRIGSTGPEVISLQNILIERGFLVMPPGVSKGYYGPLTESALKRFEASQGISPTPNSNPNLAPSIPRTLGIGSTGADVVALQNTLISTGYLVMPTGVAKGYYGPLTKSAHDRYLSGLPPVPQQAPTPKQNISPGTQSVPATTPKAVPSGSLTIGSKGEKVTELQNLLIKKGYLKETSITTKGTYDQATSDAVKRYQFILDQELTGNANDALIESLKK